MTAANGAAVAMVGSVLLTVRANVCGPEEVAFCSMCEMENIFGSDWTGIWRLEIDLSDKVSDKGDENVYWVWTLYGL